MRSIKIMNSIRPVMIVIAAVLILFSLTGPARADEAATAGRMISSKWHDAVITAKMVIRMRIVAEGREANKREFENEATATVIDPSGLAVLSLTSIDATDVITEKIHQQYGGMENAPKFSVESEVVDLKMILPDGTEVPAKIVLRDKDLDLAFMAPVEKHAKPVAAVDLSKSAPLDILDQIAVMTRLGKVVKRAPSVSLYRIQAVVKKPRSFYIPDQISASDRIGAAAFTLDGKVAGIVLLRNIKSAGGSANENILPVIVPAEEIVEISKQISKGDGEKKAEK